MFFDVFCSGHSVTFRSLLYIIMNKDSGHHVFYPLPRANSLKKVQPTPCSMVYRYVHDLLQNNPWFKYYTLQNNVKSKNSMLSLLLTKITFASTISQIILGLCLNIQSTWTIRSSPNWEKYFFRSSSTLFQGSPSTMRSLHFEALSRLLRSDDADMSTPSSTRFLFPSKTHTHTQTKNDKSLKYDSWT